MPETWPATVPQAVLIDGYDEPEAEDAIHTDMEVGPPKSRRRATSTPREAKWSILLTPSQFEEFKTFYRTTLVSGTLSFNFTHPVEGGTVVVKFRETPKPKALGTRYRIDMELWVFP